MLVRTEGRYETDASNLPIFTSQSLHAATFDRPEISSPQFLSALNRSLRSSKNYSPPTLF